MRIVIATSSHQVVGGLEKYVQAVIAGLERLGHTVGLLYEHPSDGTREEIDAGLPHLSSWCSGQLGRDATLQALNQWSPDLVYCQGLEDGVLEGQLQARYPALLYAHTYYGTCVSSRKCHAFPQLSPCSRQLGPACLLFYYPRRCGGLNPGTMFRLYSEQSRRRARLLDYRLVLVGSQHMSQEYARHGVPLGQLRVLHLPMTEGVPEVAFIERTPQDRILFVGRLVDVKGVESLIRAIPPAARQLGRPISLTIAGDGPERAGLRELASQLGVSADFTGWVENARKLTLMRQADLLAMPSLWPEPFGLAGIEAGRSSLPAVGFALGGIEEWLAAGVSGELAPGNPPTVQGLSEAIVRALADPQHYRTLCRGAHEMAQRFRLDTHLEQLEAILAANVPSARAGSPARSGLFATSVHPQLNS